MKRFDKRFAITHHTLYQYEEPVFLEPHLLRFEVRKNPYIRSRSHVITVKPSHMVSKEMIDAEDNHILSVSFEGLHNRLEVKSKSELLVADFNPFGFIIFPEKYLKIGFQFDEANRKVLHAALSEIPLTETLKALNDSVLHESGYDTLQYLILLTNAIHSQYQKIHRHDGPPLMPEALEKAKEGSCRDLAYMQMALGRSCGLACRFVSGYVLDETIEKDFELHAWVEFFLPGGGWIGFDPSTGLAVDSRYVPVACSAFPENTLPVSGSFRGSATSKLDTKITVEKLVLT